ncbi:hypothetical protein D9615_007935 [Tricholomella constricta]|uniref:Uncharacterized protein n=1 Tax=Tricholomella constricta TaxID=117010 RepID=A0A8H5LZ72_9AGAR|nr:hypothetical protein D9615_007935 [Tricholomella constricta]
MTMAAPSTPQIIRDNAHYHSQIIATIAELDYIPSALSNQASYVKDLEVQLQKSEAQLKKLSETTMKERKEHAALRDSTARRLAHKLTGRREKFEAKESKEEREYVEALEKELSEKDSQNVIRHILGEAKQVQAELSDKAQRYEALKQELSVLYLQIFDGPTQDFPEDDRLEYQLQSSQTLHDQVQSTLNIECQAAEILARADRTITACKAKVQEALGYSQWDMWGGGGMSDVMERNALSMAQSLAKQTEMLCRQAQSISPFVNPVGRLEIAQGSLMSDVFFDNIFTDMAFHRKITASAADLERAHSRLKAERDAAQKRANNAGTQLIEVSQTLEADRIALDSFRRETFQRVSQERGTPPSTDRPPSYRTASVVSGEAPTIERPPAEASSVSGELVITSGPLASYPEPEAPGSSSSPVPPTWGTRNPYAAALAVRTPPNNDEQR